MSVVTSPDFTEAEDPIALFRLWLEEAASAEINDPEAMALATVDDNGLPDARTLLCKGADARGLVFYGNVESAKGRELAGHPKAAALFHWKSLRRQARFRGPVSPLTDGGGGFVLRHPSEAEPDRRLGEPAVPPARIARRSRGGGRNLRQALRRRRHSAAGLLARLAARAGRDRVLARRRLPPARSGPLHPGDARIAVGAAPALSLRRRMSWSAAQYVKFEEERTRPVRDLVSPHPQPGRAAAPQTSAADPGNSTEVLRAALSEGGNRRRRQFARHDRGRAQTPAGRLLRGRRHRRMGRLRLRRHPRQRGHPVDSGPRDAAAGAGRKARSRRLARGPDARQSRRAFASADARGRGRRALGAKLADAVESAGCAPRRRLVFPAAAGARASRRRLADDLLPSARAARAPWSSG